MEPQMKMDAGVDVTGVGGGGGGGAAAAGDGGHLHPLIVRLI